MPESKMGTFTSLADFSAKFVSLFKGPTFYATFACLDKRLTKKIMITVSIANDCSK